MITIGELMAHARDVEARRGGIAAEDIETARRAGMLPADVAALRAFTATAPGFCIVVRCPKPASYAWQGLLPAKIGAISKKTGDSGTVSIQRPRPGSDGGEMVDAALYVSDYDLMGVWQWAGDWQRVRIAAQGGAKRGPYGSEAAELLRRLNRTLVTKIQHGCQDDWASKDNRGVKAEDGFCGILKGEAEFIDGSAACRSYYLRNGLGVFPYDAGGAFTG